MNKRRGVAYMVRITLYVQYNIYSPAVTPITNRRASPLITLKNDINTHRVRPAGNESLNAHFVRYTYYNMKVVRQRQRDDNIPLYVYTQLHLEMSYQLYYVPSMMNLYLYVYGIHHPRATRAHFPI